VLSHCFLCLWAFVKIIIFVYMRRVLFVLFFLPGAMYAQVRVSKLVIKPKQVYDLGQSDILVADTIVMMDSSRLILNKLKPDNFIRVKSIRVAGNYCIIDGRGVAGQPGREGIPGITPGGPCLNGTPGKDGTKGLDGTKALNLSLYFDKITVRGQLIIDLSGGTGGRGGNGGAGGGGSPGTRHCNGGNGANGGKAGVGGNGGNGGALTIVHSKPQVLKELILSKKIIVRTLGGDAGPSGKGGYHGGAGLGPLKKNGKDGEPGPYNSNGVSGEKGSLVIQAN
jgi:hypothetical protein